MNKEEKETAFLEGKLKVKINPRNAGEGGLIFNFAKSTMPTNH